MGGSSTNWFFETKKYNFNNDNNDLQSSTKSTDTHPSLYPIGEKFKSFGWSTVDCNGNSNSEIFKAIAKDNNNKPKAIIAKTMKGFPISFMKDIPMWHYRSPNKNELKIALEELKWEIYLLMNFID